MNDLYHRLMLVIGFVIIAFALLGCGGGAASNTGIPDQSVRLTVQQVAMNEAMEAWRNQEVIFIDVRTPEEYNQGHVPGATLLPLAELESRRDEIVKDKKVLLICRSGSRSAQANLILQKYGFTNTSSVNGGMNEWREEVEK